MSKTCYCGGTILTMTGQKCESLLVENGRIAALGRREDLCHGAKIVDLTGGCLLPSFLDPHSHVTALASTLAFADLSACRTFDDILAQLCQFVSDTSPAPDQWIIGYGYEHNYLQEGCHPDRTLLDRLDLSNPVMITHASGHMGVLSTRALSRCGVDDKTPDPEGGRLGRDPETGKLNGYAEEAAFISLSRSVTLPGREQNRSLMERAQQIYLKHGITTIQDGLTGPRELEMLTNCELLVDTVAYADMANAPELLSECREMLRGYRGRLRIGGYKLILDGSHQGRTAWLRAPYEGSTDRGYPVYQDQEVESYFRRALEENTQILVHCNGDAACEQMLRCYRAALVRFPARASIRPVMIHAQLLPRELLPQVKELGILPSYFVAHTYFWGDVHRRNLGARAHLLSPAASTQRLGIPFTLHQDTPVLPPDMLMTLWCATHRETSSGVLLGPEERLCPLPALRAVTEYGAYQYFEESSKGTLAPGKLANLTVLSGDPLTADPRTLQVLKTIREGEVLYEA